MEDKTFLNETEENEISEEEVEDTSKTTSEEDTSKKTGEDAEKKFKTVLAQKEHYRSKVGKLEEQINDMEGKLQELNKTQKETQPLSNDERLEDIEFLTKHREVSPDFIDEIRAYARGRSISLEDAYKSEVIKTAYNAIQEKRRKEEKIPEPSSRSFSVEGKDISEMSKEEIKQNYDKIVQQILRKSKNQNYQ